MDSLIFGSPDVDARVVGMHVGGDGAGGDANIGVFVNPHPKGPRSHIIVSL